MGCLGKSLAALFWSLKQPVGRNSPPWFRELKLISVQKGSHWGACSEMLEGLALCGKVLTVLTGGPALRS